MRIIITLFCLSAINEVNKCIAYILYEIMFSSIKGCTVYYVLYWFFGFCQVFGERILMHLFFTVHFILGLGKESKIYFFIQYLLCTYMLILCTKVYTLFGKLICNVTYHMPYRLALTYVIEVRKHIVYIFVNINTFPQHYFYDILFVMLSFQILENFHILDFCRDFYTIYY